MDNVICIQCEKSSPHNYQLKCNHYLCSKCLTKALFFTNFKGIAELDKINIVCNCQKGKTELKTDDIIAFIQKANDLTDLTSINAIPPVSNTTSNTKATTGLQHQFYQSFFKNISSIEDKYFDECNEDYQRKNKYISDAIIQIITIGNQFKQKFDKAFQRAKRFFMLLKLSLYDHYNMSEEELTELIHIDDVQFKSNLNDDYVNISNIYNTVKHKKEFNTKVVFNKKMIGNEEKKEDFKWLIYLSNEKDDVIKNMKLKQSKSQRKMIQLKQIDINNVIINDYSNTVYDMMKMKEKELHDYQYKKINKDLRWISKVSEVQYGPKIDRLSLLRLSSDVSNVEYNYIKKQIEYKCHNRQSFALQKLYNRYEKNTISSCEFVELISKEQGDKEDKKSPIKELVYNYEPITQQLTIHNEERVIEEDNDIINSTLDKSKEKEKRSKASINNEELIKLFMTTKVFTKQFNLTSMKSTSFIPFECNPLKKIKLFDNKTIMPHTIEQLAIPQRNKAVLYQLSHSDFTVNKENKQYHHSSIMNEISYHSNIRVFPLNALILQSTNFILNRKSIVNPICSNNNSFSISPFKHFLNTKLLYCNNSSFKLPIDTKSKILRLQQSLSSENNYSFSISHTNKSKELVIEAIRPFEIISLIQPKYIQICALNHFSILSKTRTDKSFSNHSSKSVSSISNTEILESNKLVSDNSLNIIIENNLQNNSSLNREDDKKAIQQYRNNILSSLAISSFKIHLNHHLKLKEDQAKASSHSNSKVFLQKNTLLTKKSILNKNSSNKKNQPVIVKEQPTSSSHQNTRKSNESNDENKKKSSSKEILFINSSTNELQPLPIPKVAKKKHFSVSKTFKSTNKIEPYDQFYISSKETDIEIKSKAMSPDINRKQSLTLSLSSESKEIISNINGFKCEQYNQNASTESTGVFNRNNNFSLNRLSEDEINLMTEIAQSDINPFKSTKSTTPKSKFKQRKDCIGEMELNNYTSQFISLNEHSYANTQYEDEREFNPSRANTSNVLQVNKSSSNVYKTLTQNIKKIAKGACIPSSSIILPSTNVGMSPKAIKKFSSFLPSDDAYANNEGIKCVIQVNEDLLAYCSYDSPDIVLVKNTEDKDNDKLLLKQHTKKVNMIINLPNAKIASCSLDSSIIIWNIQDKQSEKVLMDKNKGEILCLLYINNSIIASSSFWTIQVWDFDKEIELFNLIGHNSCIHSIAKLSDDQIASYSQDSAVKIWNLNEKREINSIYGGKSSISAMVSISSKRIGLGIGDHSIKIFSISPPKELASLKGHSAKIVYLLKLNIHCIASSSKDLSVIIWNIQSMTIEKKYEKRLSLVNCMSLLKNSNLLVASKDSTLEELTHCITKSDNMQDKISK